MWACSPLPHAQTGARMMDLALDLISSDPALQMRTAGIDLGTVQDYAEAMTDGAEFPAIIVFTDGNSHWPADGFHRIEAARKVGKSSIAADVRLGSRRDAILFSLGANGAHGLRRSNADKRRSVTVMLRDPEWSKLSDREIGQRCGVDHKTVGSIRREMTDGEIPQRTKAPSTPLEMPQSGPGTAGGSMVEKLLSKATDTALVAECRRRGLEVSK